MRPFVLAAALLFRHLGGSGTDDCDGIALESTTLAASGSPV